ncbi:putative membrane protein [Nocardioides marinisabuli]|uniref:Putative membrane protein n=1 Tax=Nocardioides marinisabuli TaxID=419476 RepID=A0A7Y9F435_9ACTN|nr:pilus assembly protein TadG-related protein [Nocardioides marinisabuli]NYD58340.1 putative membrane protein [Nocardioides marinisabuli]
MKRAIQRRRRRDRHETGAVAVFVAVTSLLLVTMGAFAVDLGMQRVVRSDMQALADVVAIDAARLLDGRTAQQVTSGDPTHDSLDEVVAASLSRNRSRVGQVRDLTPTLVTLTTDTRGARVPVRDPAGDPVPVPADQVPDAVLVTATGSVDFAFAVGEGQATRSALANASTYACFRLGSFAAALDTGGTPVGDVFDAMVKDALGLNLKAVGYQGLLRTTLDLGQLAARLGIGSPQELASLGAVRVADLLDASAHVLGQEGNSSAQAEVLSMARGVTQSLRVDVGQILSVGDGSVLEGRLNVVDLLGSVALGVGAVVSNGNNFLDTGVAWSTPHVSSGNIELRAIEAPQQACGTVGSAVARTAQVALAADLGFTLPNKLGLGSLGSLDVSIPTDPTSKNGTLRVAATLAGASGRLVSATCGGGTATDPEGIGVMIDTNLLTTEVSLPFRLRGTIDTTGSSILPGTVLNDLLSSLFGLLATVTKVEVTFDVMARTSVASSTPGSVATAPTNYLVPPRDYSDVESSAAGSPVALPSAGVVLDAAQSTVSVRISTLTGARTSTVSLTQLNLAPILNALTSSVITTSTASVIANVNKALVPVSSLLGIRTAGADLLAVTPPVCGHPSLVG